MCLAFVIFYIPDFLRGSTGADAASGDTVAMVEGHEITADEFRRTYQAQLQAYRIAYGGNMNEQLLKQLGIEQQILQQMVDERAALAEADRLGIKVSDEEVRQRIFAIPAFQENGAFIGEQRYQQLLRVAAAADDRRRVRGQRPPLADVDKLRASLTDWLSVSDKELEQEYRRRNDKVKLAVVELHGRQRSARQVDGDRRRRRDATSTAHKDDFKIPEKRKVRYLLIDIDALRAKVTVAAGRRRARLQRQHRAVHDARTGAREPHPAEDRRQGRRGGEGEGRRRPEAGEGRAPTSRSSRRSTPRTTTARRTAATSTTSAAAGWCRSSTRRPSRWSRARSAIS